MPFRILSISDHEAIRLSRELLLQSVGYSVVSMSSDCALGGYLPLDLDLAIICQTIDDISAMRIAARLRKIHPRISLLRLTKHYSRPGEGFDGNCLVEDGPAKFLSRVAQLAEKARTFATE